MNSRWQNIYQRIIKRPVPHAILSWRYFLPNQSRMVALHRKTFLNAWADYPRIVWCLIAIYSFTLWYLFYAWRQVYRTWKRRHEALFKDEEISPWQQLRSLLTLALLHSTPPHFYYQYRLYQHPEREWLNFIYTHELPHWHRMMSPNISERSQQLMSHKHDFAQAMAQLGLPSIESLKHVQKGSNISEQDLFSQQSLFIKPEAGSRKQDCYALIYDSKAQQYRLEGDEVKEDTTQTHIKAFIDQKTAQKDYVFQPLLKNHPTISERCQCTQLVTIRLITKLNDDKPCAISAVLELPFDNSFDLIIPIPIELETGTLQCKSLHHYPIDKTCKLILNALNNFSLPQWHNLIEVAEKSHQHFPDIDGIGWDLAITPDGVRLIEGNINWAVAPHQYTGNYLNALGPSRLNRC